MLLANLKKSKAYAVLGVLLLTMVVCLGFAHAVPAKAAVSFCCSGVFSVDSASPSLAALTLTSELTESDEVQIVVSASSSAGSSQQVFIATMQPATPENDPTTPRVVIPWTGTFGPYTVPSGATITATLGGTLLDSYTNTDTTVTVTPIAPTSDGTTVTIPVAVGGSYVYKDFATNEVLQPGPHLLVPNTPLTVIAAPALPKVVLTTTGPWSFEYVPPTPILERALPPHAPTFVDKCGTADDTILYPELVRGIAKYVTGDQPGGSVVVTAALLEGFAPPRAPMSWPYTFSAEPCAPATNTGSKPDPKPEVKPNPVPAVPHLNQPAVTTPVVTQAIEAEKAQATAVTSTDRNYTIRGAASGVSQTDLSAWPLVAVGVLVLAAAALTRRRSVTGASE